MAEGAIKLEGLDNVLGALESKRAEIARAASIGLRKGAMLIIADSQRNIRANGSWTSGLLANSGRAIYRGKEFASNEGQSLMSAAGADDLDVGFFDKSEKADGYAMSVEFGRPSGKMPPPPDLKTWVCKKWQLSEPRAIISACWGLAKHIARWGTRPHPFFVPAVNKNTRGGTIGGVCNEITKEAAKAIRSSIAATALKARSIMQSSEQ